MYPLFLRIGLTLCLAGIGVKKEKQGVPVHYVDGRMTPIVAIKPGVTTELELSLGFSVLLVAKDPIDRFVVGDPRLLSVTVLTERELVLVPKKVGMTNLLLWERHKGGERSSFFRVKIVAPEKGHPDREKVSFERVKEFLGKALEGFGVKAIVMPLPGEKIGVVLRGEVETPRDEEAVKAIAEMVATKVVSAVRVRKRPPRPLSPEEIKALRVKEAIGISGVQVTLVDGKIVLNGEVSSLAQRRLAEERAKPFGEVINRLRVKRPMVRQFLVEVRMLEVSRSDLKRLGVDIGGGLVIFEGAAQTLAPTTRPPIEPGQLTFGEVDPERPLSRVSPLLAQLNALLEKGQARLLAEQQQVALEGTEASFLVGGAIPIPVFGFFGFTGAAGAASVTFFPFGVSLGLRPRATEKGEIFLQMRVEVSSPDFNLATQVLGTTVPGFRFRSVRDVKLMMHDGQSVIIAGLIQDEVREQIRRIPILSRLPILGELFKSREFQRRQTELVIVVTIHMREVAVTEEALWLLREYQERKPLGRPTLDISGISLDGGLTGDLVPGLASGGSMRP